jgi:hypothetical protein
VLLQVVNLTAVANANNHDGLSFKFDVIDDPVVADAQFVETGRFAVNSKGAVASKLVANQLILRRMRSRTVGESFFRSAIALDQTQTGSSLPGHAKLLGDFCGWDAPYSGGSALARGEELLLDFGAEF